MIKKIILSTLFITSLLVAGLFYVVRPPVEIMDEADNCRIFTGDHFQKMKCYRNALSMYLNHSEFRDTALVAFQDLCNEGLSNACFAKDELRKESSMNFSPFQEHIDNGNKDALKCINKENYTQDPFIKDYYCMKALTYGKLLRDSFLISEILQNWQPYTNENYLSHIEHNLVFNDDYNKDLYAKNCEGTLNPSVKQQAYCKKFVHVDRLRKKIYTLVYSTKKQSLEDINDSINEICKTNTLSCFLLSEEADFIIQVYKHYPKELKSKFIQDFKNMMSFEKRLMIWAFIQDDGVLENTQPVTIDDQILKFYYQSKFSEILDLCTKSDARRIEGCFLGYPTFKSASLEVEKLNSFCSKGDKFSCKVSKMINYNKALKIEDSYKMNLLYHNYDMRILRAYVDYKPRKFLLFLDRHRALILATTLGFVFLIQILILVLFKRSENVFKFIRQTTIEKLKKRINKDNDQE